MLKTNRLKIKLVQCKQCKCQMHRAQLSRFKVAKIISGIKLKRLKELRLVYIRGNLISFLTLCAHPLKRTYDFTEANASTSPLLSKLNVIPYKLSQGLNPVITMGRLFS